MDFPVSRPRQSNIENRADREGVSRVLLSMILRGGVITSAVIIALGLLLFLITGQSGYTTAAGPVNNASHFIDLPQEGAPVEYFPTNPTEIWQGVLALKPFAIIMLGLALLIITPVLNVALATLSFLRARDRGFVFIGLFVLAVLALSFFLGKAGG